jgi:DNA-binding Xre family transcriptional regulator
MSTKASKKVSYRWHLRVRMAERGMYAASDLLPLLAERGVVLSREQVYRLVAQVPERLSLTTLAALCDALELSPGAQRWRSRGAGPAGAQDGPGQDDEHAGGGGIRPRRARVAQEE